MIWSQVPLSGHPMISIARAAERFADQREDLCVTGIGAEVTR